MNITGNMLALWERLTAVGNDALENSAWRTPSLVFDGVAFSGLCGLMVFAETPPGFGTTLQWCPIAL